MLVEGAATRRPRTMPLPEGLTRADLRDKRPSGVAVTGVGIRTRFGNAPQTFDALLRGESAVVVFDGPTGGTGPRAAAPLGFRPTEALGDLINLKSEGKWYSEYAALQLLTLIDAFGNAGLLGENGKIDQGVDPYTGALYGYSGVGQGLNYIDISDRYGRIKARKLRIAWREGQIRQRDEMISAGVEGADQIVIADLTDDDKTIENIRPQHPFQAFTDQANLRAVEYLGIKGRAKFGSAACASGLFAIEALYSDIMRGKVEWGAAGGTEQLFDPWNKHLHSEQAFVNFDALHALSRRSSPFGPFDSGRDGFSLGEGSAMLVLESIEHAQARGANILAILENAEISIDGFDIVKADPQRVSRHMAQTLYNRRGRLRKVDVNYGHYTATGEGDSREAQAWDLTMGKNADKTAITGTKGSLLHTMGASGAINSAVAVMGLDRGVIVPTTNLVNRGPEFDGLDIVTEARIFTNRQDFPRNAVVYAFGFGGQNAGAAFTRP